MNDQPIPTEDTEAHIRMRFTDDEPLDTDENDTEAHIRTRSTHQDPPTDGVQPKWE